MRWLLPALVATFCGLTMAMVAAMHRVAVQANEASRVALTLAKHRQAEADDASPRRNCRPDAVVAPLLPAPPLRDAPVPPADPARISIPSLSSMLATLRPATHDPDELLRRAQKLREAGMDLILVRTELSRGHIDLGLSAQPLRSRVFPIEKDGVTVGVRFYHMPSDSLLGLVGIENGDVVMSINGYAMAEPAAALAGYASAEKAGTAVVELLRDGRRIVLVARWATR